MVFDVPELLQLLLGLYTTRQKMSSLKIAIRAAILYLTCLKLWFVWKTLIKFFKYFCFYDGL